MPADFKSDGYQIFRQCIPKNVTNMIREHLERSFTKMTEISDTTLTGHFPKKDRLAPVLWEVAKVDTVQSILKDILKTNSLRMALPVTARFVRPKNLKAMVPPHQDASYKWRISNFITMWMPLVEIDELCGGVSVFEGSPSEVLPTRPIGLWNEALDTSPFIKKDCAPMSPGDLLIFNKFMIHASMPNLSYRTRFSVDYRFFGAEDLSKRIYLDIDSWRVCEFLIDPTSGKTHIMKISLDDYMATHPFSA
jgi:hypothetical protein